MAQAIAEGYAALPLFPYRVCFLTLFMIRAKEVPGVEVEVYQVAETLPEEVITAMHATGAKQAMKDVPVINADRQKMAETLKSADGWCFPSPRAFD